MKIVVIGGSGLIGSNVVNRLRRSGHQVVAASPNTGVNTITGEGLAEASSRAPRSSWTWRTRPRSKTRPSWSSSRRRAAIFSAPRTSAGAKHHVALSVVGADRLPDSGYLRAKVAQEKLIKSSGISYTILRSTQFFEFVNSIIKAGAGGRRHSPVARAGAAGRVRRRLGLSRRSRRLGAAERHGRDWWPGEIPDGQARPAGPGGARRQAVGRRRCACAILRNDARRSIADGRRRRPGRVDPSQGMVRSFYWPSPFTDSRRDDETENLNFSIRHKE